VHPSIVRLYDVFLDSVSSAVYLVLEPLEGTARQLMASRKGRPFAQGLLVDMGRQLCEGLAYLHEQGYVHRNLWPESIFASTFGLAKW
ncbi:kinase-like protein, partial [Exidia glandulosa HHB12029]